MEEEEEEEEEEEGEAGEEVETCGHLRAPHTRIPQSLTPEHSYRQITTEKSVSNACNFSLSPKLFFVP